MPISRYGVLKGKAKDSRNGQGSSPHFQVKISDHERFRIAISVKSKEEPSALLYCVDESFDHPILKGVQALEFGFHDLQSEPGSLALDFIRGNLFDTEKMKPLPYNVPGPDNDLNEMLHRYVERAMAMENSEVYAFGQRWGPEDTFDQYFDFKPGNGIHDIHMNQGNSENWTKDDGPWQDGGILFHFPDESRWVAVFLAFQSQCFHTDDASGHRIAEACDRPAEDKRVRIVAALVNPSGPDKGLETVTLINTTAKKIDLSGWKLADRQKRKMPLAGTVKAGEALRVRLIKDLDMTNDGGIITLLDAKGLKVDGVSYTAEDASHQGWTIIF